MTISYPALAFAFNPVVIDISGASGDSVTFETGGRAITRPTVDGKAYIYVQAILQSLFDRTLFHRIEHDDKTLMKKVAFSVKDGSGTQFGSMDVIWGALQIGEIYSQSKKLTRFNGLPFTVPLYLNGEKSITIRDDRAVEHFTLPAGKYNIDLTAHEGRVSLMINGDEDGSGIFDYTFDYTFRPIPRDSIFIEVDLDKCNDGHYLRWINEHGEYCYYLFSNSSSSYSSQNGDININEFVRTIEFRDGYSPGSNRYSEKNVQRSIRLFASLVDKTTLDMLEGLPGALIVDLHVGKDEYGADRWMGVNITPGTFSRTKGALQDFECTLLLPANFNQSL